MLFQCFSIQVPESPRWLMRTGNFDKAEQILRSVAKSNGVKLTGKTGEVFQEHFDAMKEKTMEDGLTERG